MKNLQSMKSLFISPVSFLKASGGGVQWCTREYIETIRTAGLDPQIISYDVPRDYLTRLNRKLFPFPYRGLHPTGLVNQIIVESRTLGANLIFLNNNDAASLAPALRRNAPDLKLIYLSHGVEITDVVNNLRISPEVMQREHRGSRWIGDLLKVELEMRDALDAVICISEEDVSFEKWLGAKETLFLPRQIATDLLKMCPVQGRVGTVATLDHGPNLHGLRLLAAAMSHKPSVQLRLVGGPEKHGLKLEKEFPVIKYLGRLTEDDLKKEASTWCAFVNPIFCQARGASTKVATALGWGLPVLTTKMGARGYCWNEQVLPLASNSEELSKLCFKASMVDDHDIWIKKTNQISEISPNSKQSADMLRVFLSK